jgi:regulator of protease activity HflC (stomatin/prohibitin superfamily)
MLFLCVLLLVAAVVLYAVGRAQDGGGWKLGAAISAVAAVLSGVFACVHVVSAYEVGVPVTFGSVGEPLSSGVNLSSPFTDVTTFSTRPVDLDLDGEDRVEVRSSEGGVLYADVTVKWAVVPKDAVRLYQLAGSEEGVQDRLVTPDSREIIRNVFAQHTSEEGYASARERIGAEIADLIEERLAPRGIDVTAVNLRNVRPSKKLQDQIDAKLQQEQATQRAEEAARTAEAEARRRRIEAKGIADSNKILERSLSDKVLQNQCLEAFKEAAKSHPVYASPCGSGSGGSPVIVDGTKN